MLPFQCCLLFASPHSTRPSTDHEIRIGSKNVAPVPEPKLGFMAGIDPAQNQSRQQYEKVSPLYPARPNSSKSHLLPLPRSHSPSPWVFSKCSCLLLLSPALFLCGSASAGAAISHANPAAAPKADTACLLLLLLPLLICPLEPCTHIRQMPRCVSDPLPYPTLPYNSPCCCC